MSWLHSLSDITHKSIKRPLGHVEFHQLVFFQGISLHESKRLFYGIGPSIWHGLRDIRHIKVNYQARIQMGGAGGARPPVFAPNSLKSLLNWPKYA